MSAGMGLLITPITTTVTSGIDTQDADAASGLMNATRQIGGAIGMAALVTLATTVSADTIGSYRAVFATTAAVCTALAALAAVLPPPHQNSK